VVRLADGTGSTAKLLHEVEKAAPGSTLVIGTEATFVRWIASRHPSLTIVPLRDSRCPNMARITTARLRATLERLLAHLAGGPPPPEEVHVEEKVRAGALWALGRMIEYTEAAR